MNKPQIVLPADVYDTLELSAHVYGGIGAGRFYEYKESMFGNSDPIAPMCLVGHIEDVANDDFDNAGNDAVKEIAQIIERELGSTVLTVFNDRAVETINKRKNAPDDARVSWEEYCTELNIVRGN